jgi:glycosyltransferase involved in cell wall biosynthesis
MSKHIGFYLDSTKFNNGIDLERLNLGNPGIGGTEYTTLLLAIKIAETKKVRVALFITSKINLSKKLQVHLCDDIFHAVSLASSIDVDLFVLNQFFVSDKLVSFIDEGSMKCAVWTHIYIDYITANIISNSKNIKVNVFVGKQQYDYFMDHPIINKSIVIYNGVSINSKFRKYNDGLTVTYLGALYYSKYFHVLAKVWKDVLKKVPNARLNVIGSGNLYDQNSKLGPLGVSSEEYENLFLPYLQNEEGVLLESVSFFGRLGFQKNEVLINTSVGIVNPTGITECLPMSVLEFSSFGVPVVTKNAWGYPDVIIHNKTGILYNSERMLAKNIVKLLKNQIINNEMSSNARSFTQEKYNIDDIVWKWVDLISDVSDVNYFEKLSPSQPYLNQLKFLRIINKFIREKTGLNTAPIVEFEKRFKNRVKKSNSLLSQIILGYHEKYKN